LLCVYTAYETPQRSTPTNASGTYTTPQPRSSVPEAQVNSPAADAATAAAVDYDGYKIPIPPSPLPRVNSYERIQLTEAAGQPVTASRYTTSPADVIEYETVE